MSSWAVVTVTDTVTKTFMIRDASSRSRAKELALKANKEEQPNSAVPPDYHPGFDYTLLEDKAEVNSVVVSTNLKEEDY